MNDNRYTGIEVDIVCYGMDYSLKLYQIKQAVCSIADRRCFSAVTDRLIFFISD